MIEQSEIPPPCIFLLNGQVSGLYRGWVKDGWLNCSGTRSWNDAFSVFGVPRRSAACGWIMVKIKEEKSKTPSLKGQIAESVTCID